MQDYEQKSLGREFARSTKVTVYAVDEKLLRKNLRSKRFILLLVWLGGISLFLLQAVAEDVTFPPPGQWVGVFLFLFTLGPALLYLYAKTASIEITESSGSELEIHQRLCSLRRPMRLDFRDVNFPIKELRDAYANAEELTLVFRKREHWMRNPLPGFYPTVHLIGIPAARQAALTLSVRSGAAARLREGRRRGKKLRLVAWFFVAGGWLLLFLVLKMSSVNSINQLAVTAVVLFFVSALVAFTTLQHVMDRCKIRLRWMRRKAGGGCN